MHKTKSDLKREEAQDETQRIEGDANAGPVLSGAPQPYPDGKPYREPPAVGLWSAHDLHVQPPPPHGTYHQITLIEQTNDKDWMHRNMDLADLGTIINKQFEKLWQFAALFAVGMVMMGGLIWILAD